MDLTKDSMNETDPFGDMSNSVVFEDESENRDKSDENDDKETRELLLLWLPLLKAKILDWMIKP